MGSASKGRVKRAGTRRRLRVILLLLVGALSAVAGLTAWATDVFRRPELDTVDLRFSIRGPQPPPGDVLVVGIDDVTFQELNVRFPFRRTLHAQAIDRLREAGARVIAYDVQFTEASKENEDLALYDSVARARNVVLATSETAPGGKTAVLGGEENLRAAGAVAGITNYSPDPGGVFRRAPYRREGLKSFAVLVAERASGRRIDSRRFTEEDGGAWIDYAGPPGTVQTISFSRLTAGRAPPSLLRDKVVVVGAVAPTLQDVHATSVTGDQLMSGPEINANAISTLLRGFPLRDAPGWLSVLAIAISGLWTPVLATRLRGVGSLVAALGFAAAYLLAAQFVFQAGVILPLLPPLFALAIASVGVLGVYLSIEVRERRRLHAFFTRFVPEPVIDEVIERAGPDFRLPSARLDATVMFCDLRGFTPVAESLEVDHVIRLLDRYVTEMSDAILDHGGTVVHYLGDGIMAVFGAPIERHDHADHALGAALEMLDRRLPRFNTWLEEEGLHDTGFRMGIGLHSGELMSGTIGSARRLEYDVVGDTTNAASRVEELTKTAGHDLLFTESTRQRLVERTERMVEAGEFYLAGREAPVTLWTVRA